MLNIKMKEKKIVKIYFVMKFLKFSDNKKQNKKNNKKTVNKMFYFLLIYK